MKIIHCDICGKEVKSHDPIVDIADIWNKNLFMDINHRYIEDVCDECYKYIHCCINMMKETKWRPDFHEVLESDNLWDREVAGNKLYDLEKQTGLKLFK